MVVLIFGTQVLVAAFLSITMRGWWFPGRMLISVLPLLAIPLAVSLSLLAARWQGVLGATLLSGYSLAVTAALVLAGRHGEIALAVDPFRMPAGFFQAVSVVFPMYTTYTVSTWLLTLGWVAVALALVVWQPIDRAPFAIRDEHPARRIRSR